MSLVSDFRIDTFLKHLESFFPPYWKKREKTLSEYTNTKAQRAKFYFMNQLQSCSCLLLKNLLTTKVKTLFWIGNGHAFPSMIRQQAPWIGGEEWM